MERKNRTVLMFLIAAVIVVAVISSFGLPLFSGPTAEIVLPTAAPTPSQGVESARPGEIRVEIAPDTVQDVIAALNRLESYSRTVTTALGGVEATARVWVDGGWTRTDLTTSGRLTAHTIVGEGRVWRWYSGDVRAVSWPADEASADLDGQRIPTYEDVLSLPRDRITAAGYGEKNGFACVYVEVEVPELDQLERYWVGSDTGLLMAAETVAGGEMVYSMTSSVPEIPASSNASFLLPDGTLLHKADGTTRSALTQG